MYIVEGNSTRGAGCLSLCMTSSEYNVYYSEHAVACNM